MAATQRRCLAVSIAPLAVAILATELCYAQQADSETALKNCFVISDDAQRLRCLKDLAFPAPPSTAPNTSSTPSDLQTNPLGLQAKPSSVPIAGDWRLVRTPNPKGGKDAVSVMRTADFTQSDPNLAGLVIRCGEREPEVLVVVVRPLPPRARPQISIVGTSYEGAVIPPGTEVLLSGAAREAQTRWLALPQLDINIVENGTETKGVVRLNGLDNALSTLHSTCLSLQ